MNLFDCKCGYRFIIGEDDVYGPIYSLAPASSGWSRGRMMMRHEFSEGYADCEYAYIMGTRHPPRDNAEQIHPFTD